MKYKHAFVLLSGGIDSTTCLFIAHAQAERVTAISINYGQRHVKELEHAAKSCDHLGVTQHVIDLSSVVPRTMLTDTNVQIPNASYDELPKGVSPTYVPFRNGLMLAAIASYAAGERVKDEGGGEYAIYYGPHAEDSANWAYPDCTPEFNGAMANAIYVGTYHQIRLVTPLQYLGKADIIQCGDAYGVKWWYTWSCYAGGEIHCGTCPTCKARKAGFIAAEVFDPTEYES